MVTNINLSSPELAEKRTFSGKSALVFSAVLMAVVFGTYFTLMFLKSSYTAQQNETTAEISAEQSKISGPEFSDVFDFQGRLNLLDKAIGDHSYWHNVLVNMGGYLLPEVRLDKFSGKKDPSGSGSIDISGTAANLDALSRELILLKTLPNLDSMEFKDAGEVSGQNGQPGGISFEASLKINKSAFQK